MLFALLAQNRARGLESYTVIQARRLIAKPSIETAKGRHRSRHDGADPASY